MGDSSETVFQGTLFLRDCTCPKPECNELELEIHPPGGVKTMVRLPVVDVQNLQWFMVRWLESKAKAMTVTTVRVEADSK
jgi:hypothetical protein